MSAAASTQLVTFFGNNKNGISLTGIGLTDAMIEQLKKDGAVLQEGERTGSGVDVALFYAPTLNELVQKIKAIKPENTEVRFT